jgi:hypothetical protein
LRADKQGRLLVWAGVASRLGACRRGHRGLRQQPVLYDDAADGPVTATVKFDGQPAGGRCPGLGLVAPPDYARASAPSSRSTTSRSRPLWVAFGLTAPAGVVPAPHLPVLERVDLRWVLVGALEHAVAGLGACCRRRTTRLRRRNAASGSTD